MRISVVLCFLSVVLAPLPCSAGEWPQWRGPGGEGVMDEQGLVEKFDSPELERKWTVPIGSGYTGPTVADGRVYVMDRVVQNRAEALLEIERVHCIDFETGDIVWTYAYKSEYKKVGYKAGPRASVTLDDGRAFSLGTMGHLHCFDVATGDILWKKDLLEEYGIGIPIWGVSASPIVYDDLLIVQAGQEDGGCLIAFNKATGEKIWRAVDGRASYSTPVVIEQADRDVLIAWTGEWISGLDPKTGEVFWRHPTPPNKMVINVPTPVVDGNRLFITGFYDGSWMLQLSDETPSAEILWRREGRNERETDALHSMMSNPILDGDHIYGVDSYGQLRCLDASTGDRIWEDTTAVLPNRWGNIHMVRDGDRVWMFNEQGELLIGKLSPQGFEEISRAKLIDPTPEQLMEKRPVCWSHPAYAYGHIFIRNDKELVCASLKPE